MGYLFWEEGITFFAPGPFSNIQAINYWSGTEFAGNPSAAWSFLFAGGGHGGAFKASNLNAWAVFSGDVNTSVVPIPTAVWLFGSGLIGLLGVAKRKR